ncbi:MAG: class I SAM-dependent methyltransferase, partial [Candidatus Eremiobacteraeota bacterium]|nr:class I SAM-dependent methyltransferase [Candidatus Eremiobacteraeota bacterium]
MTLNGASSSELEPTGERFHPTMRGAIRYEHLHRYALCLGMVDGLDVLDIASGEGYGSALLASRARRVTGVDVEPRAVERARRMYYRPNVRYLAGDCAAIPLADAAVDVVVSFETLEHVDGHDQMLSEIRRVLRPGGRLVISSPNRLVYSDEPGYANPYHVRELYYDEFLQLLERHFPHVRVHGQRLAAASFVYPLAER